MTWSNFPELGVFLLAKICQWRRASRGSEETFAREARFDQLRGGPQAAGLQNLLCNCPPADKAFTQRFVTSSECMNILMKILYIGNERRNAQAVATALRASTPNLAISWTQSLEHCATYFAQNRDLAALVMDAQAHAGRWPSSLKELRSLQVRPAIVVIVPEGTSPTFDPQAPAPDDFVINSQTFSRDLAAAVSRAVARARGSQPASSTPSEAEEPRRAEVTPERKDDALADLKRTAEAELERKLADLTAAFQQAQRRHTAALAAERVAHELAATEQLTEQERQFQAQITQEREKRQTVEEMLSEAASDLEEAERRCAAALADVAAKTRELERVGQREAELLAHGQTERVGRAALEQALVDADVKILDTQRRHDAALAKAAEELAEQRTRFDRELSRMGVEGDQLRERLIRADSALHESRHNHESAVADIARLTQRETDLLTQLAQAEADRHSVEGKLSDALRDIAGARESAARERAAAENRLELKLAREIDARTVLERKLGESQSATFDAERRFREEAAALRAHAQEREAHFDARLTSERTEYDTRLAELQLECERLRQARATADENLRAAERARTELQQHLQTALAAGRHDIEQIQETLMAAIGTLEATKRRQESLQAEAERIPESHEQRHESRTDDRQVVQVAALQHNQNAALV
jgi:cell division protein ZapA (FtsZ GTPase activity inhibitor)